MTVLSDCVRTVYWIVRSRLWMDADGYGRMCVLRVPPNYLLNAYARSDF